MPKYLFQATYTSEGIKGLEKDKASGRKAALSKAVGFWEASSKPSTCLLASGIGFCLLTCPTMPARRPSRLPYLGPVSFVLRPRLSLVWRRRTRHSRRRPTSRLQASLPQADFTPSLT